MWGITGKQWSAIYAIENKLGVKFTGRTKKAAGWFIGKYMKLSMATNNKEGLSNESALVLLKSGSPYDKL